MVLPCTQIKIEHIELLSLCLLSYSQAKGSQQEESSSRESDPTKTIATYGETNVLFRRNTAGCLTIELSVEHFEM